MKSKSFIIAALLGAAGLATLWATTLLNSLSLTLALRAAFGTSIELFSPTILLFIFMLMIGCVFVWLKISHPLQVALAGTSVTVLSYVAISQVVNLRSVGVWAVWLFVFAVAAISFGAGIWALKFVKKKDWLAWAVAAALAIIATTVQAVAPPTPTVAQSTEAPSQRDAGFASTVTNLNFDVHQPAYAPSDYKLGKPQLWGYDPAFAGNIHPYVTYSLGSIAVQQSKVLDNQEKILNFNDLCDLEAVWFGMTSTAAITDEHAKQATSSPCTLAATTPTGKKIYTDQKNKVAYAYTQLDGTNVVFRFDASKGKAYTPEFLPELIKVVDSLKKIDLAILEQGEY